jgi:hypothetical protein
MSQFSYGRLHVPESFNTLATALHVHDGTPLKTVSHDIPLGVLDQQDLLHQGIYVSEFIPQATDVDALGSCTANATTAALSFLLDEADFLTLPSKLSVGAALKPIAGYEDTVAAEEFAIGFYHDCTDQTGTPDQEYPPTDCGSSGPYIVELLQRLGLVTTAKIAASPQDLVSLLQSGPILQGTPFLQAWEEPNSGGFVDGDGSHTTFEQQLAYGIAGGHETVIAAIETLALTETGHVIPHRTVLRVRNSWSASWGDHGDFRIHLSTLSYILSHCDFRLLVK